MFKLIRLVFSLVSLAVFLGFTGVILAAALVFTGDPPTCVDRNASPSALDSAAVDIAWIDFAVRAAKGPAQLTLTEAQVTARGQDYVDASKVPVKDLQVYFCPDGHAEASGRVDIMGVSSKVVVEGTLDLSGATPRIQIDSLRAGNLPSAVAKPVIDQILNKGDFRSLDLGVHLTAIDYADGSATLTGGP